MYVEGWQKCMYGGKCSFTGLKKKEQDKANTVFTLQVISVSKLLFNSYITELFKILLKSLQKKKKKK